MNNKYNTTKINLKGYVAVPHEVLHIIGFRLVGIQCKYQWGNLYVTPIGSIPRWKRLVGRLFPFTIFFICLTIFAILAGLASEEVVQQGVYGTFLLWCSGCFIATLYLSTTIGDLRRAYLLIVEKPWYSWTPFDFLYWPVVDWEDIRKKVSTGDIDVE